VTIRDPKGRTSHTVATRALGFALAFVAFALYSWRSSLSPFLLDSAELAAASFGLGIAHPPGESLALLLGRLFCTLPMASVTLRVSLGQSVCGAAAVGLVYALAFEACNALMPSLRPSPRLRAPLCAAAALVFAVSPGAVDVASRPEVYALATLLALAALWCAQAANKTNDARWAVAAAFALGLGLANHPLIAGTAGMGAVVACVPLLIHANDLRQRLRLVGSAVAALLAGASVLSYVPARAYALLGHPDANTIVWGDARTVSGLWWILSARTFANKNELVQRSADPLSLPFMFIQELGIPTVCLALLGVYALVRFTSSGRLEALLLFFCGAGATLSALAGGLDPHNPDVRGYLACAFAMATVFAGVGACAVAARLSTLRSQVLIAMSFALALLLTPLWALATDDVFRSGQRQLRAAETAITQSLFAIPPRAVLATAHFETAFLVAYQRLVQVQRPDLTWVHFGWAGTPGYSNRMLALSPQLAPLFADHRTRSEITSAAIETMNVPIALESSVPVSGEFGQALSYAGGLWHWPPQTPEAEPTGLQPFMFEEAEQQSQVRGFLGRRVFQDARLACRVKSPLARGFVEKVQRLLPGDEVTKQLPAWCAAQGR
jgi:hypothetical protein